MGLDNRDYLRDESRRYSSGSSGNSSAPMCRKLLIVTIAVFILQVLVVRSWTKEETEALKQKLITQLQQQRDEIGDADGRIQQSIDELQNRPVTPELFGLSKQKSVVQEWLQLETPKVLSGQIWRLITCAFCHDRIDLWHILINMLFLWWFGPRLESMYGSREFLVFYLSAALAASLSYVALDLFTGNPAPMVGASGAIMAVLALFALHFPTQTILIMFIIPVEVRWLVLIYVVFDLHPVLLSLAGEGLYDGVAHAAHLGGLAFGYAYGKRQFRLYPLVARVSTWWRAKRRGLKVIRPSVASQSGRSQKLADEMDAILKKISEHGEASLSRAERKTLEKASRELRDRQS